MIDKLRDRRKRPVFIHSSLDELPLTMEAFRVYCHLARRVNDENRAWPSYRSIGEICFRGSYPTSNSDSLRRKAIAAVSELIQWNLIGVEQRNSGENCEKNSTNIYCLTDESEWNLSIDEPADSVRKGRSYKPRSPQPSETLVNPTHPP